MKKNYTLWGPSARTCLELTKIPAQETVYSRTVQHAADSFTSNSKQFRHTLDLDATVVPHRLFIAVPIQNGDDANVRFATDHVAQIVTRAYAKYDNAARVRFYNAISGHMWFAASAGYLLENYVLLWLSDAPAGSTLFCSPRHPRRSHRLEIPVCVQQKYFHSVDYLKQANNFQLPICLIPISRVFPTVDVIVLTNHHVITIQVTVSSRHNANQRGFDDIFAKIPRRFQRVRTRCHVFMTDAEDKAKSLRSQVRDTIPEDVHIYSAVVTIGDQEWDSCLTPENLERLNNARVRKSWLHKIDSIY